MEQFKLFNDHEHLQLPEHLMEYVPEFFNPKESDHYLKTLLLTIPWQQTKVIMYEKEVLTPRLSAWLGDRPLHKGDRRRPNTWTRELLDIKKRVEAYTGMNFNGVLLNYYRDEKDSVAWHSDKDTVPGMKTEIASISFGQARNFDFRNKQNPRLSYSIELENGSLLLMKGDLQRFWEHRIAKCNTPLNARINLTFRKVK